jgi:calcineurin-like phosphoesterase family protein
MPETWFISDTHFGHKNIIEYEPEARPFKDVKEMNEYIIHRWNDVVRDVDLVYHLGDFCFGKDNVDIAGRLKGRKILVMGNHDNYSSGHYSQYFQQLVGSKQWEGCILTHLPVHPNQLNERWKLNVHGHLHGKQIEKTIMELTPCEIIINDPNYFNVSCEQNNLTPINADIIRERIRELT